VHVRASIEVRRPLEVVWAFVANPCNDLRWCPKVRHVEPAGDNRWKVLHQPVPLRPATPLILERVEAEPLRRMKLREEDAASIFEVEYRLGHTADGTAFTQTSTFHWKRLPRIAQRILAVGVRRDVKRQLRELKRVLEIE
jgi:hypothetical protein